MHPCKAIFTGLELKEDPKGPNFLTYYQVFISLSLSLFHTHTHTHTDTQTHTHTQTHLSESITQSLQECVLLLFDFNVTMTTSPCISPRSGIPLRNFTGLFDRTLSITVHSLCLCSDSSQKQFHLL